MEEMPRLIIGIVIALVVLAVGVTAYFTLLNPLFGNVTLVQNFTVTDPTVTQTCILTYRPNVNSVQVEQYNGISWNTVASTWVGINGKVVTVAAGGLEG